MTARLLGDGDEPQDSGAIVAVHYGDYRRQQIFVRSGANIGNWYPLGGEFGIYTKTWDDNRNALEKISNPTPPPRPEGTLPRHPDWYDVVRLGPVTLLTPGDNDTYVRGWKAGRRDLWQAMEDATYDEPRTPQ